MANYLEIVNDRGNVCISDGWNNQVLLSKIALSSCRQATYLAQNYDYTNITDYPYVWDAINADIYSTTLNKRDVDVYTVTITAGANIIAISKKLLVLQKAIFFQKSYGEVCITFPRGTNVSSLYVYQYGDITPTNTAVKGYVGLWAYNANGTLVFDSNQQYMIPYTYIGAGYGIALGKEDGLAVTLGMLEGMPSNQVTATMFTTFTGSNGNVNYIQYSKTLGVNHFLNWQYSLPWMQIYV